MGWTVEPGIQRNGLGRVLRRPAQRLVVGQRWRPTPGPRMAGWTGWTAAAEGVPW